MQSALLQLIETGHVARLGGIHPIPVDVRTIATTTIDLEQAVAEGRFLSHLYYRFAVFNMLLPQLRQRIEDVPLLSERFLARFTERESRAVWIDDEAMAILSRYPWPGNVRELESVLEQAIHRSRDGTIAVLNLPEVVRQGRVMTEHSPRPQPVLTVSEAEREAIITAGWACQGRVSEMAQQLDIGRTTLWRKMKRYSIRPEHFK
jgi:transcriptional activator for dhaKLM operon